MGFSKDGAENDMPSEHTHKELDDTFNVDKIQVVQHREV